MGSIARKTTRTISPLVLSAFGNPSPNSIVASWRSTICLEIATPKPAPRSSYARSARQLKLPTAARTNSARSRLTARNPMSLDSMRESTTPGLRIKASSMANSRGRIATVAPSRVTSRVRGSSVILPQVKAGLPWPVRSQFRNRAPRCSAGCASAHYSGTPSVLTR